MSQANIQLATGEVRPVAIDIAIQPVTSGGATKTVTFSNVKTIRVARSVAIVNSSNVRRVPSGAVTFTGNVLTVADGSYANGDTIIAEVLGYNL
jgi:hypothetical protein